MLQAVVVAKLGKTDINISYLLSVSVKSKFLKFTVHVFLYIMLKQEFPIQTFAKNKFRRVNEALNCGASSDSVTWNKLQDLGSFFCNHQTSPVWSEKGRRITF